ncbi:MAG: MFS transporter [Candidatus Glassbacteria bacterium]|nr:MFS transporter [Candidatus Glassbacteria bacterium]
MIQLVAILSVFSLGIVFSLIGAVKLKLAEKLGIDDAKVGGLISTLMFTSIFVVLFIGPLVDAWGHKPFAILGFLLSGVAILMLGMARSYGAAVVACILLGVGGMCVNTVGNTLLSIVLFEGRNAPAALNLGNMFFGLGAFFTPFLAIFLIQRIGLQKTVSIIALVVLVGIAFGLVAGYPELSPGGFSLGQAFALLGNSFVLVAALALFCYVGLEVSMGGWITTYLTSLGYSEGRASGLLSAFWISIMISRLVSAMAVTPENGALVVTVLALVATVSIGIMATTRSAGMAGVAVVVTGLAFGPIFPSVVGVTFSKVAQELQGSVFAIIFAIGLLGATILPAWMGMLSKGRSIQKSMVVAAGFAVMLTVIAVVMGRLD